MAIHSRILGILAVGSAMAVALWMAPLAAAGGTNSSGYSCLASAGGRKLDGPTNDGIPGEWIQGDSTQWLISCDYPDPTGLWEYSVAWTPPASSNNTFEGCGSAPADPLRGYVSPDHWAYASANIDNPPAPLAAAAEGQLTVVEAMAKLCAPVADTTTSTPDTVATAAPVTVSPTSAPVDTTSSLEPPTTTSEAQIRASITSIVGDVEVKRAGTTDFVPATLGTVLRVGDFVATGFDSTVTLQFDYGELKIYRLTQLRIDEFVNQANNIQKTQLFLRTGSIEARVSHTSAIRGDFSVASQYLIAAGIRDSAMIVTVASDGSTTVYTTEDSSTVQGRADGAAINVPVNDMSRIGSDGKASAPAPFSASDLPQFSRAASTPTGSRAPHSSNPTWIVALVGIAAVLGVGVFAIRRFVVSAP